MKLLNSLADTVSCPTGNATHVHQETIQFLTGVTTVKVLQPNYKKSIHLWGFQTVLSLVVLSLKGKTFPNPLKCAQVHTHTQIKTGTRHLQIMRKEL